MGVPSTRRPSRRRKLSVVKVTAIYGHPTDPAAFEKYYAETHTPIALRIPNLKRFDLARAVASPGQSQPTFYRIADLWFEDMDHCLAALTSPEGQATAQDLAGFATGGVTLTITENVQAK
jgi:uncharacterized protein (TIGR02118 family)